LGATGPVPFLDMPVAAANMLARLSDHVQHGDTTAPQTCTVAQQARQIALAPVGDAVHLVLQLSTGAAGVAVGARRRRWQGTSTPDPVGVGRPGQAPRVEATMYLHFYVLMGQTSTRLASMARISKNALRKRANPRCPLASICCVWRPKPCCPVRRLPSCVGYTHSTPPHRGWVGQAAEGVHSDGYGRHSKRKSSLCWTLQQLFSP